MADTAYEDKRIRDEAAGWYAKLNNTTISTETLRAFRAWRNADERRAEAYREIEAFWRRAGKVENEPEIQRAVGEALAREKQGSGALPRVGPRGLAGAAIFLVLGFGAVAAWPTLHGKTYQTATGEQRYVRLDDGTRLRLDTATRVRVKLQAGQRDVELISGRAFFDVARDPARPFVVEAGGTSIRALGTRFSVARDIEGADVTLVEGKVRVDRTANGKGAKTWMLSPGDRVDTARPAPQVLRIDAVAATSWTSGRLTFLRETLGDAAAEVSRYGDRKIVIEDPAIAAHQISGVFDAGDTDAFVKAVSDLYGLEVEIRGDEIRMRRPT